MVYQHPFLGFKRNSHLFVLAFFALLHLAIVIINHCYFRTYSYDYGVYNFAFYDFAHFRVSPCPVYHNLTNVTFMQDHFSLTLPILSPLYWIFGWLTGTYSLLIIQWAFIVWGGYCTYRFVLHKAGDDRIALFSLVYYFIIYNRFSAYQSDCNLAIIGAALLPVFLYYFEAGKLVPTLIAFVFLIVNREDFSLTLVFMCIFLMIVYRKTKKQLKLAFWLFWSSLAGFLLIFGYLIPLLETDTKKFSLFNYSVLGTTPAEAFMFIVKNPLKTLRLLVVNHSGDPAHDGVKAWFYFVFGFSGGILLFLRPVYLICLIPLIAKKMFNDDPIRWSQDMYHSIEITSIFPILVFSVIAGLKRTSWKLASGALVCLATGIITYWCIATATNSGLGNIKYAFLSGHFYKPPANLPEINSILNEIPPDAPVSATGALLPHLALREKIYFFPRVDDAEYLCIRSFDDTYPITREESQAQLQTMLKSGNWSIVLASGNCMLWKKKTARKQINL